MDARTTSMLCAWVAAAALALLCPGAAGAAVNEWTTAGPAGAHVRALAVQDNAPPTVYAGTSTGVWRSVDDGGSWAPAGLSGSVTDLAADPLTLDTVYAIAGGAVYRTVDGGGHWTQVRASGAWSVAVDSLAVYVGGADGVSRSADGGDSWTATGLGAGTVEGLAASRVTPGRLWAEVHSGPASYAVHRSDDGGDTWSQTAAFPNPRVALAADTGDSDSA